MCYSNLLNGEVLPTLDISIQKSITGQYQVLMRGGKTHEPVSR